MSETETSTPQEELIYPKVVSSTKSPYLSNIPLVIFALLVEWVPGLARFFFLNAGLGALREKTYQDTLTAIPLPLPLEKFGVETKPIIAGLEVFSGRGKRNEQIASVGYLTASHFRQAYLSGKVTPLQVAEKLISLIESSNSKRSGEPPLNGIYQSHEDDILEQAKASTDRYAQKKSVGLFDGVPVAIKDELDVKGYETNVGTVFINRDNKAGKDAYLVVQLKKQGAIIIGKTSMHELGLDISGNNPKLLTARNPYNPNHYAGGSSGGNGCVVAAGLCPIAIGVDGGGSIRVPSSFCGIYGLKTTSGRISQVGEFPVSWSNSVSGPMAASVDDLALTYYAIAGKDPEDERTWHQPPPTLHGLHQTDTLSDLKIGIFSAWNHQMENPVILSELYKFIDVLKDRGASIVEIEIAELEEARIAHIISFASEALTNIMRFKDRHKMTWANRSQCAVFSNLTPRDYIQSQQIRTRIMRHFTDLFSNKVNLILSPATMTAPVIYPRSLRYGEHDGKSLGENIRFQAICNFAGIPAISFPVGYDDKGLPIGLQFMAKWYDEATLLRVAKVSEEVLGDKRRKPASEHWFGNIL